MLPSPPSSPTMPRGRRSLMRRCERVCCGVATYFPLLLVHGLSTWAVWVEVHMGLLPETPFGTLYIVLGVALYVLLNWCYSTAVFTDPGSPATSVPRDGDAYRSAVTVKSDGGARFCKKCQARKPDRAHHCSTCRRCVLKMDHHCPWLATCVGFRNYKPFLLFLVYSSLFAWLCFLVSATWLYHEVMIDRRFEDTTMPVHFVILSVISGIIALVLSAFSGYHVYLTSRNRTTIESLEKTRYLSPLRERADQRLHEPRTYVDGANDGFGERLRHFGTALTEMHVNALPGVLRSEEGEGDDTGAAPSPALASLRRAAGSAAVPPPTNPVAHAPYDTYHPPSSSSATFPRGPSREERQYDAYLDERDSARLPHAFDLGWRRNMLAVLGPSPLRWFLPVCNSPGDGWTWERSPEWARRRDALRLARVREREERERQALAAREERGRREAGPPRGVVAPWREAEAEEGEEMLPPPPRGAAEAEDEDEEDLDGGGDDARRRLLGPSGPSDPHPGTRVAAGWNDVPTDMLGRPPGRKKSGR